VGTGARVVVCADVVGASGWVMCTTHRPGKSTNLSELGFGHGRNIQKKNKISMLQLTAACSDTKDQNSMQG